MAIELGPGGLREVFGDDDPTRHAEEAEQRWGDTEPWREAHRRTSTDGRQDRLRVTAAQEDLEERFAGALRPGAPAHAQEVRDLAEEHRRHLCAHFYAVDAVDAVDADAAARRPHA